MKCKFQTPILFIFYNRKSEAEQVFSQIRMQRPAEIYLASDGPKEGNKNESLVIMEIRKAITDMIDWECTVHTRYNTRNKGCKIAVSEAINWFFSHVERGIILEDDCLPSKSFFRYCEVLLDRYKDDERIAHIAGFTLAENNRTGWSYHFSRLVPIWGWATWRRAWKLYDVNMTQYHKNQDDIYRDYGKYKRNVRRTFDNFMKSSIDTWDTQWAYACVVSKKLTILPKTNLIQNIGFGEKATHTRKSDNEFSAREANEMSFPLNHPTECSQDRATDEAYLSKMYKNTLVDLLADLFKGLIWKN